MREILSGQWGCGHSPPCTCLTETMAQSQRSGVTAGGRQGQRFITLQGVAEPSVRRYSAHTTCPVEFSLPPLFLILPNGSGKEKKKREKKLLTAASETNCGVWISKPSVGGFTLKRFSFTHCPLHQSEGPPESVHQERLPSDPASSCWFILFFGFLERTGLLLTGQAAGLG